MSERLTEAERREMRHAAEQARFDGVGVTLCAGLLNVEPRRLLALLHERDELEAEVRRLRAELAADRAAVRALVDALSECSWYDGQHGCEERSLWDSYGQSRCNEHKDEPDDAREALRALQARMATWEAAPAEAHIEAEPDDSPRCEVCDGPARDDDPGRAYGMEDAIYACGGCARKLDADDHELDVAAIRQALEADADVSAAIDWPAFWSRRARLGKAAESIEAPVEATVEWMGEEATCSSEASAREDDGIADEPAQKAGSSRAGESPGPDDAPDSATNHRWGHLPGCLWDAGSRSWGCVPGCPRMETPTRCEPVLDAGRRTLDRMRSITAVWAEAEVPAVPPEPEGDEETAYDVGVGR